jgi:hypothetical protein
VTINHSSLWQKHVAWAKPDGAHLKQYITGHYSSIMVLLSLLLTACINVFFNSSVELAELRKSLLMTTVGNGATATTVLSFSSSMIPPLKFWIGLILLLDIFVTLLGLIATFTLWGMISAISDANAHCVLRSSLGQYSMSLPPRLVVASLYIFLLWSGLFVLDLVVAPLGWILVVIILVLFWGAIVIPLSALGRLILQTGAMAQTPILPHDLEQQLLPSGLQASLLLRALHRQRRMNTHQHDSGSRGGGGGVATAQGPGGDANGAAEDDVTRQYRRRSRQVDSPSQRGETEHNKEEGHEFPTTTTTTTASSLNTTSKTTTPTLSLLLGRPTQLQHHHRQESVDFCMPRASILNSAISNQQLHELVESTFALPQSTVSRTASSNEKSTTSAGLVPDMTEDNVSPTTPLSSRLLRRPPAPASGTTTTTTSPAIRRPLTLTRHHRRASSTASALVQEWTQDVDVRELYGATMPAELPPDEIVVSPDGGVLRPTATTTVSCDGNTADPEDSFLLQQHSFRWSLSPSVWWNNQPTAASHQEGNDDAEDMGGSNRRSQIPNRHRAISTNREVASRNLLDYEHSDIEQAGATTSSFISSSPPRNISSLDQLRQPLLGSTTATTTSTAIGGGGDRPPHRRPQHQSTASRTRETSPASYPKQVQQAHLLKIDSGSLSSSRAASVDDDQQSEGSNKSQLEGGRLISTTFSDPGDNNH